MWPPESAHWVTWDSVAHAGTDDLRLDIGIIVKNGHDIGDQICAGFVDIIQPAQEGADVSRAGAGRQQCLIGRKNQQYSWWGCPHRKHLVGLEPLSGMGSSPPCASGSSA